MNNDLFGNTIALQQASLNFLWNKMQVNLHNISNVNTPGYKTKFVTFEEEFRNRLTDVHRMTNDFNDYRNVIDNSRVRIHTVENQSARFDENNVNMDAEQVEVMRTSYQYNYLLKSINSDITRLKTAIKVG